MEGQSNPALEAEIGRRIRERGRITFAEFMDLALYHPQHGYYRTNRQKIGPRGDFLTSPETHPVFGALVALQLEQMWRILGNPPVFTVVEMGGGTGALCRSILEYSQKSMPEFYEAVRYVVVERQGRDGEAQEGDGQSLFPVQAEHRDKVLYTLEARTEFPLSLWERVGVRAAPDASSQNPFVEGGNPEALSTGVVGCFLSNELVDAFPVHAVTFADRQLREVFVGLSGDGFVEETGDPSTSELVAYFHRLGLWPGDGYRAEVNLEALGWMGRVARALDKGFVLTIDYGFPAEELYSDKRRAGTLMCYYRHTYSHNPFTRVGAQDMTTHVDFTSLIHAGLRHGLRFTGLISQADFLSNLGLEAFANALGNAGLAPAVYYDNKFALRRLVEAQGLGRFQVLVQHKGVVEPALDCLNPCNDRKRLLIGRGSMPFIPLKTTTDE